MGLTLANIGIYLVFGTFALSMLPDSPFKMFIDTMDSIPYLDVLNWFLPVTEMLAIGQAWLLAVSAFYVISLVLRWIKMIS